MNQEQYYQYLNTEDWKERRNFFIDSVGSCELCRVPKREKRCVLTHKPFECYFIKDLGISPEDCPKEEHFFVKFKFVGVPLLVHHKSYDTVGYEQKRDILVVCHDCHSRLHQ